MLADVLTFAASWNLAHPLLSYQVPAEFAAEAQIGQLVAVPYGERLVEGIIWELRSGEEEEEEEEYFYEVEVDSLDETVSGTALRPIRSILDREPALLPYQMTLAVWLSDYYVTALAVVVQAMLPPGLVQRSQTVLRLVTENLSELEVGQGASLRIQALVGLLLSEGEINIVRLKEMLGPKRARELLKEVRSSGLIEQEAELAAPKAKVRTKRIVRLLARDATLEQWRDRMQERLQMHFHESSDYQPVNTARKRPEGSGKKKETLLSPWAISREEVSTLVLTAHDKARLVAQRQLAAVDLLLHDTQTQSHWTPNALCKASGLTDAQLNRLVQDRIVTIEETEVRRDPMAGRQLPTSLALELTPDQQNALDQILENVRMWESMSERGDDESTELSEDAEPLPILLHGVTGSGKTEVYLQALAAIIAQGKRGMVLVPEIALTTQAVQRVAARFPERVAIVHSELSTGERYDEWRRIRAGEVDVVIGSRSALFAPLPDLGIIIVDEEHEPAYKQSERRPTYHAREAALILGQILRIPVVLGSATPSLESFYRAVEERRYQLVELPARIGAQLPLVEVVDLRNELHAGNTSIISRRLQEELEKTLQEGQQAILFLNRRGTASCILCRDCGYVAMCEDCDVPLTYHSTERLLLCHYCGRQHKAIRFCPNCKGSGIRYFGLGTERVQETIQKSFPQARLLRWDRDTARNRHAHEQLLDRFANREADILIGTQMIAKGLDLPGVTLVGVVSADIGLNIPDFASPERTFTLLTQVAGRAGRGKEEGRVIVQTFNPQHFCVDTASRHDYHEFYTAEIEARRRYRYPPFRQFVKLTYSHENRHRCQNEAMLLYEKMSGWIERLGMEDTDIVGPAPALTERVRNKYHWQMIVRGPDLARLLRVIDAPDWDIDIDPVSAM
ncbi:MAG TPA: primosomal protein N' [Ktedonobacteraceae bacterium]|jgi:primosomal protein N' (replication factor Y)